MECLYQGYFQNFGHLPPNDTGYYAARRELVDPQQTTNTSRWHPYIRSTQSNVHRNADSSYNQYPHHFDHSNSQFPVWSDVTTEASIPLAGSSWCPSNVNYSYPNLNFLQQDRTTKLGQETDTFPVKLSLSPTQTFPINSQYIYSGLGENYEQFQPCNVSRRSATTSVGHTRTRDKYRIVYTEAQRIGLEEEYKKSEFITEKRRAELAAETDLSERQIKFWFQNRRVKDRRGKTSSKTRKQQQEALKPTTPINTIVKRDRLDDQSNSLPPCRFAETRLNPEEPGTISPAYNNGNCVAMDAINSVTQATYGCGGLPPPSGMRYPVSPSEWGTLSEATLLTTLNVSPILTSMENGLNPRS